MLQPAKRTPPKTSPTKNSNTQRTKNKTTDVLIHQHSRKHLMMDILMSETCWAHNKWNKIASGIKLVIHSSTVTNSVWLRSDAALKWNKPDFMFVRQSQEQSALNNFFFTKFEILRRLFYVDLSSWTSLSLRSCRSHSAF